MDPHITLPTAAINPHALPRDRSHLDPAALQELARSIASSGLRQPIEVWRLNTPSGTYHYGLISGLRRLTAYRHLAQMRGDDTFTQIAAFVRSPQSVPEAMAAMIAENEIRSDISAWEKGATLIAATKDGIFPTLDAAVLGLHPTAPRQKRARLRAFAEVVDELADTITTPDLLSVRQMHRLASALRGDMAPLIHLTLSDHANAALQTQWAALLPLLNEPTTEPDETNTAQSTPRPRRLLALKQGLTIRRERSQTGWILRFSGPQSRSGGLIDDVLDKVEEWFQPK